MNFDLVTYHYYLGYSGFTPRFHLDYLPAGFYGYQSPLPYMPLYWLDHLGMPAVAVAITCAAFQSLNLVLLYVLTEILAGKPGTWLEHWKVLSLWLLGAIAPVYWTLVGTSFADASASVLVLAALWVIARSRFSGATGTIHSPGWVAIGGAFLGIATALRAHNGVYAVGMLCALAFAGLRYDKLTLRTSAVFALAALVGWLIAYVPWGYRLYREFRNPFFPLFNGLFHSPDFPASNVPFISFTPGTISELVTLPFWIATDTPWIYVELPLPDIRPLLLSATLLAALAVWISDSIRFQSPSANAIGARWSQRFILMFFAISGLLWLATSANGRFGTVLFLLGGPVCGVLLLRVFPRRYALMIVALAVLWQALLQEVFFRQYRFNSIPWTASYFEWNLPEQLQVTPATFVSFGFQPGSTLAPRLHPDSSHINLSGYPAIDAPGSGRVRRLLGAGDKPLYGVVDVSRQGRFDPASVKAYYTKQAALWGLSFADNPCDFVTLRAPEQRWSRLNETIRMQIRYGPPAFLLCRLERSSRNAYEDALRDFQQFKEKLLRFGAICPQFFGKPLGYVRNPKGWSVTSFASGALGLEFDDVGSFYVRTLRPPHVRLELGHVTRDAIVAKDRECRNWFLHMTKLAAEAARGSSSAEGAP